MRDISHKQISLRSALVRGIIFCSKESIELIKSDSLPKGNLFGVARAAGFIGAKLTPQLLPHCHPVSIDSMDIKFEFLSRDLHTELYPSEVLERNGILITGEAKSIGRTGIEMEMLTAVSIAALEIYDMLKPVDSSLEISHIKLVDKKGGKSDRQRLLNEKVNCAILVCSDSTAQGTRKDESGKLVAEMLKANQASIADYKIVPDEIPLIQEQILTWIAEDIRFIFTCGGTGLGPRDNTVAALRDIIERDADGISEAMRAFGQMRTPLAMMSRSIAGSIGKTLIVALPGSVNGARESLEAILPGVFHAGKMLNGEGH